MSTAEELEFEAQYEAAIEAHEKEQQMDPNVTIKEIRELTAPIYVRGRTEDGRTATEEEDRIAALFTALDEWLSKGGFLPDAWKTAAGESHWQAVLSTTNERAYKRGYEDAQFDAKDGEL